MGEEITPIRSEARTSVVAGRHLAMPDNGLVHALEPRNGNEVWTQDPPLFETSTTDRDYPVLRQASPDVVALVDVGKNEGDMAGQPLSTCCDQDTGGT